MGRRAKNKQAAPESLDSKASFASKKQLGKRKAEADTQDDEKSSPRPTKRAKDLNGKGKEKSLSKPKPTKVGSKKKTKVVDDDGSEGWEDIEDGEDLRAHKKSVVRQFYFGATFTDIYMPDPCSMKATKKNLQGLWEISMNSKWMKK